MRETCERLDVENGSLHGSAVCSEDGLPDRGFEIGTPNTVVADLTRTTVNAAPPTTRSSSLRAGRTAANPGKARAPSAAHAASPPTTRANSHQASTGEEREDSQSMA